MYVCMYVCVCVYIYIIYTPGQKYKITLKNEKKLLLTIFKSGIGKISLRDI